MRPGPSAKGLLMKRKVLSASAKIFLERGYDGTSSKLVAALLDVSNGSPFFQYGNKEGVLLELVKRMFSGQFQTAEGLVGPEADPLLLYAVETALQLHIVEQSGPMRELYATAYTLPTTSQYINESVVDKLSATFHRYMPEADDQVFFHLGLASSGVMRSFLICQCDEKFPIEQKLRQFLGCCFKIFDVPQEQYLPVIDQVIGMDLAATAQQVIQKTIRDADEEFEAAMAAKLEGRS